MQRLSHTPTHTYAFPFVGNSNGSSQDARGSPEVARAGVNNPVIAAEVHLRQRGLGAQTVARHAEGTVGLVHHARRGARTLDIVACLCREGTCIM